MRTKRLRLLLIAALAISLGVGVLANARPTNYPSLRDSVLAKIKGTNQDQLGDGTMNCSDAIGHASKTKPKQVSAGQCSEIPNKDLQDPAKRPMCISCQGCPSTTSIKPDKKKGNPIVTTNNSVDCSKSKLTGTASFLWEEGTCIPSTTKRTGICNDGETAINTGNACSVTFDIFGSQPIANPAPPSSGP